MATITNAFTTYDAQANREDLSNAIYNIDPFDTPVMSMIGRRNAKNRTFDWQKEHLPATNTDNAQPEGFELVRSPAQPTVRLSNVTQISKRDATVTGSQEEADAAGKSSEMAHQMAMASKALKTDMETIMCSRQPIDLGAGDNIRRTEAIGHWLGRATDKAGNPNGAVVGYTALGLPLDADDAFAAVAGGSQVAITEIMVNNAMEKMWTNGGKADMLILPPGPRRTVSTFVGRSTTQVLVGKTEVVSTVDVIATDFGRIKVLPSRWLPLDVGYLLDSSYVSLAYFRNFRQFQIAKIGDAETRVILCEWGIEMKNPLAHIMFNGIKAA